MVNSTWVVSGVGAVLPGPDGKACQDLAGFLDIVNNGRCCLSDYHYPGLPLRVAGQVHGWDPHEHLRVNPHWINRWSRAARLATGAVQGALEHAGIEAGELDGERSVLIGSSMQFAAAEGAQYYSTLAEHGPAALGLDYWMSGTPISVLFSVTSGLGLRTPTMAIAGSCSSALRALQVAQYMFEADEIDTAIVVGLDTSIDPVFVAGTVYQGKQGFRASSLTDDPLAIRPHDVEQSGNAPGEGALAVILRRGETTDSSRPRIRCHFHTSRSADPAGVAGDPGAMARDMIRVLDKGGIGLADLAFMNDYAEGNPFIEQHLCDTLGHVRRISGHDEELLLTNQEAAFGHVSGFAGIVKLIASVSMLADGHAGPSINTVTPHPGLPATPVLGGGVPIDSPHALITSAGAGGDSTSAHVEYLGGNF